MPPIVASKKDVKWREIYEYVKGRGVDLPPVNRVMIEFSNRMTSAAGRAEQRPAPFMCVITMSGPIWRAVPDGEFAEKWFPTLVHELCHLAPGADNHGPAWRAAMRRAGVDPDEHRRHDLSWGRELYGGADFRAGQDVEFEYNGDVLSGVVVKCNHKKARVRVGDRLFRVPYQLLETVERTAVRSSPLSDYL